MKKLMRTAIILYTLIFLGILGSASDSLGPNHNLIWNTGESDILVYSIPGLLVTKSGVIIAHAEARHEGRGDGGKVDIVIKRSFDSGRTWTPNYFIEKSREAENYVLANLAQDRETGRVFFFAALRNKRLEDKTTRNTYRYSDDDGATWSNPIDITDLLYEADENVQKQIRSGKAPAAFKGDDPDRFGRKLVFFGPGRCIQLSPGHPTHPNRLIVPLFLIKDRTITPRANRGYGNAVLVSDDNGKSWSVAGTVPLGDYGSSEVSIVELADGRLMMNSRGAPPESRGLVVAGRTVAFSSDGGDTWTRPQLYTTGIPDYIETSSGLLRLSHPDTDPTGTSRILFSFPNALPASGDNRSLSRQRRDGTIYLSYDEGKSWPVRKLVVPGSFGYSNMDVLPDKTILVIHEQADGSGVFLSRFTLDWLTDGRDSFASGRN